MEQTYCFWVPAESAGQRLDAFLVEKLPEFSRAALQRLVDEGNVQLDGVKPRSSAKVRGGEQINLLIPPPAPAVPDRKSVV